MRYIVFGGEKFYPKGGIFDFHSQWKEVDDAKSAAQSIIGRSFKTIDEDIDLLPEDRHGFIEIEWSHVFDLDKGKIIAEFGKSPLSSSVKVQFK